MLYSMNKMADAWRNKNPNTWSHDDVLTWIYHQASLSDVDICSIRGERFIGVTGSQLCCMTRQQLIDMDDQFGEYLFDFLQALLHKEDQISVMESSWQVTHPSSWSNNDLLDWIYFTAGMSGVELSSLKGEKFQRLNGSQVCCMSKAEFCDRDPSHGEMLYNSLQQLLLKKNETKLEERDELIDQYKIPSYSDLLRELQYPEIDSSTNLTSNSYPSEGDSWNSGSGKSLLIPSTVQLSELRCLSDDENNFEVYERTDAWSSGATERMYARPTKENTRRQRRQTCETSCRVKETTCGGITKSSSKKKQCPKTRLSKFMRDLLENPAYNPEFIRWENQNEGIFRIVSGRSHVIADLWGKIKNNPTMTFEKLGRSLRWCRANNGQFSSIPKDGKFPKKLCFRLMPDSQDGSVS